MKKLIFGTMAVALVLAVSIGFAWGRDVGEGEMEKKSIRVAQPKVSTGVGVPTGSGPTLVGQVSAFEKGEHRLVPSKLCYATVGGIRMHVGPIAGGMPIDSCNGAKLGAIDQNNCILLEFAFSNGFRVKVIREGDVIKNVELLCD